MLYYNLADLIEKHKHELATKAAEQAIVFKVIDDTQLLTDIAGFEASFHNIAVYIRDNNIEAWRLFVEQITAGQVARGVPDEGCMAIADYMIEIIKELITRELPNSEDAALRDKYYEQIQTMHSLGRVTILVTQMRERNKLGKAV